MPVFRQLFAALPMLIVAAVPAAAQNSDPFHEAAPLVPQTPHPRLEAPHPEPGGVLAPPPPAQITATRFPSPFQLPDNTIQKSVPSGVETQIGGSMFSFGPTCEARSIQNTTVHQPLHGNIVIRDEPITIPQKVAVGDSGGCAGRTIEGKKLYYQSARGYKGDDYFQIKQLWIFDNMVFVKSYHITVE